MALRGRLTALAILDATLGRETAIVRRYRRHAGPSHLLPSRPVTGSAARTDTDTAIIGAGIIGLAVAWQLRNSRRVVVVEKEAAPALHQTGRNSGVVHSGIYYPPGSAKAQLCLAGKDLLAGFCRDHGIPIVPCGKLIAAATREEMGPLERLAERGEENGIPGLQLLDPGAVKELEPAADVAAALLVPTTGLVDFRAVTMAMQRDILQSGGVVLTSFEVAEIDTRGRRVAITARDGREVSADSAVNCAGAYADRIARLAGASPSSRIIPFKGIYYGVVYSDLVARPIYPLPDPRFPFLGVHLTPSVGGALHAGPNAVLALGKEAYTRGDRNLRETLAIAAYPGSWRMAARYWRTGLSEVRRTLSRRAFARALQTLVPSLRAEWLEPAGCGIRAQAVDRKGKLVDDFVFERTGHMVHVVNAPSPAATASLAIARRIIETLDGPVDAAGE
jgi:(S)-2-hydroxyglutarate dehydrogenase